MTFDIMSALWHIIYDMFVLNFNTHIKLKMVNKIESAGQIENHSTFDTNMHIRPNI